MNGKFPDFAWVIAVAGLLLYEGYALYTGHETLSRAIWTANKTQYGPLLPFVVGFLMGHLFWSGQ